MRTHVGSKWIEVVVFPVCMHGILKNKEKKLNTVLPLPLLSTMLKYKYLSILFS